MSNIKFNQLYLIPIIFFLIIQTSNALELKKECIISTGLVKGYSAYQIGGLVNDSSSGSYLAHFPISELKFPLNAILLNIQFNIFFQKPFEVGIKFSKNITTQTGPMKDSDWGIFSAANVLDIYSESDTTLDFFSMDIHSDYVFFKKTNYALQTGFGFIYQDSSFDVSNSIQKYPSRPELGTDYINGDVLTYKIIYQIPHFRLGFAFQHPWLNIEITTGYAPYVLAKDEDHHLKRIDLKNPSYGYPISKSDLDGSGYFFSFKSKYTFNQNWFVGGDFSFITIKAKGRSQTHFSNGPNAYSIDQEIETKQLMTNLLLGYLF